MSNKLLKRILLIAITLIVLYVPQCYAAGANISTNTLTAKPGDTVELYIDLSVASIGYDLKITTDNDNLISSSEMIDKIGSGDVSKIYLVQLAGAADRITYPSGTRIAKIKYTISNTATEGNKITFNVAGNIAGETSLDKNTMNESVTINIINPPNTDEGNKEETPPQEEPSQGETPPQEEPSQGETPPQEEPPQEEPPQGETPSEGQEQVQQPEVQVPVQGETQQQEQEEGDDTVAKVEIPKAGLGGFAIVTIMILVITMYNSFKKYSKNRDIK